MKKLIGILLGISLLLSLGACGPAEGTPTKETQLSTEATKAETTEPTSQSAPETKTEEAPAPEWEEPTGEQEGIYDGQIPEEVPGSVSQSLFLQEARRLGLGEEEVFAMEYQWNGYIGLGDSAAWLSRSFTETPEGVRIDSGILHEAPMNQAEGMDSALSLPEQIAAQYKHWEATGTLDYININQHTAPYYQVKTIALDGTETYVKVQILINGVDFGSYEADHQVLLLPVNSEPIAAKEPAVVELRVLAGQLPDEHHIFVYMTSNISGGR